MRHYVILDTTARLAIHHARRGGIYAPILTRIMRADETLELDPSGIAVPLAERFISLDALERGPKVEEAESPPDDSANG